MGAVQGKESIPATVSKATQSFAAELFSLLLADTKSANVTFSPASIQTAMCMTWAGAAGSTASEMTSALQLGGLTSDDVHNAFSTLQKAWNEHGSQYTLDVVNRLFVQGDMKLVPSFTALMSDKYTAPVQLADFAQNPEKERININDFISKCTQKRINDLLPGGSLTDLTRLVITNAVYFKGKWQTPFKKTNTQAREFHVSPSETVQVDMMHVVHAFPFARGTGYAVCRLPYQGDDLAMDIVLPDEGKNVSDLMDAWRSGRLAKTIESLCPAPDKVALSLPRFKVEGDTIHLQPHLEKLGARLAFTRSADFSLMEESGELYISKVFHKAFVEVTEEGTEAAAATAVVMMRECIEVPSEPIPFVVNRPFMFVIRDLHAGVPLFVGHVSNPTVKS